MKTLNTLIEEKQKQFQEYFVEMHPSNGHDMQNRPLLYDANTDDVDTLVKFLSQAIREAVSEHWDRIKSKLAYDELKSGYTTIVSYVLSPYYYEQFQREVDGEPMPSNHESA